MSTRSPPCKRFKCMIKCSGKGCNWTWYGHGTTRVKLSEQLGMRPWGCKGTCTWQRSIFAAVFVWWRTVEHVFALRDVARKASWSVICQRTELRVGVLIWSTKRDQARSRRSRGTSPRSWRWIHAPAATWPSYQVPFHTIYQSTMHDLSHHVWIHERGKRK